MNHTIHVLLAKRADSVDPQPLVNALGVEEMAAWKQPQLVAFVILGQANGTTAVLAFFLDSIFRIICSITITQPAQFINLFLREKY